MQEGCEHDGPPNNSGDVSAASECTSRPQPSSNHSLKLSRAQTEVRRTTSQQDARATPSWFVVFPSARNHSPRFCSLTAPLSLALLSSSRSWRKISATSTASPQTRGSTSTSLTTSSYPSSSTWTTLSSSESGGVDPYVSFFSSPFFPPLIFVQTRRVLTLPLLPSFS